MPPAAPLGVHDRVHAVFAAIDEKAVDRLLTLLAPDVVFRFGNADPIRGHDAVAESSRNYNATVAGVQHHVLALWEPEPDVAVVELEVEYRRQDGRTLRLPCCNVFRFREGLVADFRIYMDVAPVFA